MKNLFLILLGAGLFLTLQVNAKSAPWLQTAEGQLSCVKLTVDNSDFKVVTADGQEKSLPVTSVMSYSVNNKLYVKLPLYILEVKGEVFMEFVRTRDDLKLFKYEVNGADRYFVYKGDKLYVPLNDSNKSAFEKFFFVRL
ncbi:MAG TPA: hypothetical protein PKJ24_07105 [Prolixibacteraceae bacterium]|nr:hypothetical protein [Prolixibacteraceae bacterium]HPT30392.1 hypothetical protein [Prolixibacteraceae bacterium]